MPIIDGTNLTVVQSYGGLQGFASNVSGFLKVTILPTGILVFAPSQTPPSGSGEVFNLKGAATVASSATATWDLLHVYPGTINLTGSSPSSLSLGKATIDRPTMTVATPLTAAGTVVIGGAPVNSAGLVSRLMALWIKQGVVRVDDGALEFTDGTSTAVAPIDSTRFRYNKQFGRMEVSVNGAAWVEMAVSLALVLTQLDDLKRKFRLLMQDHVLKIGPPANALSPLELANAMSQS